jgi:hypothetical protein
MAGFTKTDTGSWGFKDVQASLVKNSNGCRETEACKKGTGSNPCEGCTNMSSRNDGTMGCDAFSCKCASAVAYVKANPDEFAGL